MSEPDDAFPWAGLLPELRAQVLTSLLQPAGDEQMDWNTWVAQWEEDTDRTAHKTVAVARQVGPEFRAAIDAAATTLCATIDNRENGTYNCMYPCVPLGLTRFPRLQRLGLNLHWNAGLGRDETGQHEERQPCQLQLDDLPQTLRELRIVCGANVEEGFLNVNVLPLPPTFHLPHLITLELVGLDHSSSIILLQHCPLLKRLVIDCCEEDEPVSSELDLDQLPGLEHLHIEGGIMEVAYTHLPPQLSYLALKGGVWRSVRLSMPGNLGRATLTRLDLSDSNSLAHLDLTFVPNLEHLSLSSCVSLAQLDLSGCTKLKHAKLRGLRCEELDITPCAQSLLILNVSGIEGQLQGLAQLQQLRELHWRCCPLETLDLRPLVSCTLLDLTGCQLTSLKQLPPALKVLKCGCSAQLRSISAVNLPSLVELECNDCRIKQLVLPAAGSGAQLQKLTCAHNPLSCLDLTGVERLTHLDASCCLLLMQLTLPDAPSLLQKLDALDCPMLSQLDLRMPRMQSLRIGTPFQKKLSLEHMPLLQELVVACRSVDQLNLKADPLHGTVSQLHRLEIIETPLEEIFLSPISASLKFFTARKCLLLRDVHELHECQQLENLQLQYCPFLSKVTVPLSLTRGSIQSGSTVVHFAGTVRKG